MASSSSLILALTISTCIFISLITPSHSALKCASQKLPSNRSYTNCTDLPSLSATLHFSYNTTNHSIAIAFSATPKNKDDWVSWGINPTGGKMVGAQALIAYKTNGNVGVYTYNLTSFGGINEVKSLSVETWGLSAEESNGVITIFAGVKLPEKSDNVTQVWQVGPVVAGKPGKHLFEKENLNAFTALSVVGSTTVGGANSTGGAPGPKGDEKSGGVGLVMGYYFGFVLLFLSLITTM
ncbi:putative DOMON domain-containing protein [Medicago truncatula]|uniref:Auxin-induced in root cultures protein, putative n=1 Tax=Medicago truncatula TaxID=3880 RepID=G7LEE2_MEDTR|nr:auxin-induced in root cultures protein 12 [Medicago truncatula]AET01366.1 auxin-induced in root cultures protein, putative [Medicago truncatula]RHN38960.1 putative DOMON domain-containing protein [Medicago truncatula]